MSNSTRKMFYAVVEFDAPAGNIITILANDEDHARSTLEKMHSGVKNFKIIDLHDLDESPSIKELIEKNNPPSEDSGNVTVN